MSQEVNDDISFDYDENETIDDDEMDSILSGESNNKDRRRRDIPDITLYQLLTKKRKFIHFFFRKIIVISFIPTLIYNIFWIVILKKIETENKKDNNKNMILKYSYIYLIKGFIILFLPQILCGSEKTINDFSYSCVFIKSLTSFIMSLYITSFLEKKLDLKKNVSRLNIENELYYWINIYYLSECIYIKLIVSFFLIILSLIIFKIGRELYKAIRYSLK